MYYPPTCITHLYYPPVLPTCITHLYYPQIHGFVLTDFSVIAVHAAFSVMVSGVY